MGRIVKGPGGTEFRSAAPQVTFAAPVNQQPIIGNQSGNIDKENNSSLNKENTTVNDKIEGFHDEYTSINEVLIVWNKQLNNFAEEKKIPSLIRLLAISRLETFCEKTYGLIFASQVQLLKKIIQDSRIQETQARAMFSACRFNHPDFYKNLDFQAWIDFLLNQNLILKMPGSNNETKFIATEVGQDFIKYLENYYPNGIRPG